MANSPQKRLDDIVAALKPSDIGQLRDPSISARKLFDNSPRLKGFGVTTDELREIVDLMTDEGAGHYKAAKSLGISSSELDRQKIATDRPLKSTEQKDFETGAKRGTSENRGRYDLISGEFLRRLAIHLEKGAKEYSPRNWEKGIPLARSFQSMIRHAYQWQNGEQDEDHLAAVACNLMFIIHTEQEILAGRLPHSLFDELPPSYLATVSFEKPPTVGATQLLLDPITQGIEIQISAGNEIHTEAKGRVIHDHDEMGPETVLYEQGKRDASIELDLQHPDNPHYVAGYNS